MLRVGVLLSCRGLGEEVSACYSVVVVVRSESQLSNHKERAQHVETSRTHASKSSTSSGPTHQASPSPSFSSPKTYVPSECIIMTPSPAFKLVERRVAHMSVLMGGETIGSGRKWEGFLYVDVEGGEGEGGSSARRD